MNKCWLCNYFSKMWMKRKVQTKDDRSWWSLNGDSVYQTLENMCISACLWHSMFTVKFNFIASFFWPCPKIIISWKENSGLHSWCCCQQVIPRRPVASGCEHWLRECHSPGAKNEKSANTVWQMITAFFSCLFNVDEVVFTMSRCLIESGP